jgi:pentatricopeptide repeat protein
MSEKTSITIQQVRNRANEQSYNKGQSYYQRGSVFDTAHYNNTLEGYVEGSLAMPYRATVTFDSRGEIEETDCTCPYEYGGDCKHIVALLLTYIHEPQKFEVRLPLNENLLARSKEELVELLLQVVDRFPEARTIVNRPTPTADGTRRSPLDTQPFRKEIRMAIDIYEGWGDHTAEDTVYSILKAINKFTEKKDWSSAAQICSAVLNEACKDGDYSIDDEGDFGAALDEVVDVLSECLPHISQNDSDRLTAMNALLDAYLWGREYGDYAADVPEDLLENIQPNDIPHIRPRIEAARDKAKKRSYGQWEADNLTEFLMKLDLLSGSDPEEILVRLREEAMFTVLFEKLLQLGRIDEASQVIKDHLIHAHERIRVLPKLYEAGREDEAIQLAKVTPKPNEHYQRDYISDWLLLVYKQRGDHIPFFELQRDLFYQKPSINQYLELQKAAQAVNEWDALQSHLIEWMQKQGHSDTLIRVYLHHSEWDKAWEALEKMSAKAKKSTSFYLNKNLDLEVAETSATHRPQKAIPVFIEYAQTAITGRNRDYYRQAADYLSMVKKLYTQLGEISKWEDLILSIRVEFKRLPALQDELNKAKLFAPKEK